MAGGKIVTRHAPDDYRGRLSPPLTLFSPPTLPVKRPVKYASPKPQGEVGVVG